MRIPDEFAGPIIASGRERHNFFAQAYKVFRFAGEDNRARGRVTVVERPNSNRIARRDEFARLAVENNAREFRVEPSEHIDSVFPVHRQNNLAVAVAPKAVALLDKSGAFLFETVQLAVAHDVGTVELKRLHSFRRKSHNRQPMEAEQSLARVDDQTGVRPSRDRLGESQFKQIDVDVLFAISHN